MEQVGYDTYCTLLDEVVKEIQGKKVNDDELKEEIQIDLEISSYIPDSYIENSDIKLSIYHDIALCKNEDQILDITDEILDRFGSLPKEVENLLEIARIKNMCKEKGVNKIIQRNHSLVFYFSEKKFKGEWVDKLMQTFKNKIKFSPSALPYITYKIDENKSIIKETKQFFSAL